MPGPQRAPGERRHVTIEGVVVRGTELPAAETLSFLSSGDLRILGLMPGASNYTFLCRIEEGGRAMLAVYKPQDGEAPLWDFPDGTLGRREVAAYVLAAALGWPQVPPTVWRDGPEGPGSVQAFVDAEFEQHYFTLREAHAEQFRRVAAFDLVANNADRKGGHCLLVRDSGAVWVIDHGVCFAEEPKLRTVIWDHAGEPVPAEVTGGAARVAGELRSGPLRTSMLSLLTPAEVDATARRAEAVARSRRFPEPAGRRYYPWPPV